MENSAATPPSRPHYDSVALVIVTYQPDEHFGDRVKSASTQFKQIIIIDNTASGTASFTEPDVANLYIERNSENAGLATALNAGCNKAIEMGFDWAVTLDQDTELGPDYLDQMISSWLASRPSPQILGCNYFNMTRSRHKFRPSDIPHTEPRKTVITSGCLTYLPAWSKLEGFREDYFIDSIDHEFCLRARKAGCHVAINLQPLMDHTIGDHQKYPNFLQRFSPYSHSRMRTYTNARNSTRTIIDYARAEPAWCTRKIAGLAYEALAIIFLEREKLARVKAFLVGIKHGYQQHMGPPDAAQLHVEERETG